jgi:hypothetical protein
MWSFFTIPKPFRGHAGVIQRNAVRSWARVPGAEILLFGHEEGCEEIAKEVGATWEPSLPCNEWGTPRLDAAFERARRRARNEWLCYVNADIILFPAMQDALARIPFSDFLVCGRRVNIDLEAEWDWRAPDAEARLRSRAAEEGVLHSTRGMDYFVFPRDSALGRLPPFAVGRPGWDNYFVYRARQKLGLPVVDATRGVLALHQNHGHQHVQQRTGDRWEGPEARENRSLMPRRAGRFDVLDADYELTEDGVRPANGPDHRWRRRDRFFRMHWFGRRLHPIWRWTGGRRVPAARIDPVE